ncbi:ATP-binding protein [Micromonospora sp. NBC_00898]|uniref:ATP-binding protein n=1 Tax=Micromonospora sp. NBC_00898 TaxID=2975981 RepID=UPI00386599BF
MAVRATRPRAADPTRVAAGVAGQRPHGDRADLQRGRARGGRGPVQADRPAGGRHPAGVRPAGRPQQPQPELVDAIAAPVLHHRQGPAGGVAGLVEGDRRGLRVEGAERPGHRARTGTGLGLAIVRAVAGSLGGRVVVGAAPGGGARVGLRVPETDPRRRAGRAQAGAGPRAARRHPAARSRPLSVSGRRRAANWRPATHPPPR